MSHHNIDKVVKTFKNSNLKSWNIKGSIASESKRLWSIQCIGQTFPEGCKVQSTDYYTVGDCDPRLGSVWNYLKAIIFSLVKVLQHKQ